MTFDRWSKSLKSALMTSTLLLVITSCLQQAEPVLPTADNGAGDHTQPQTHSPIPQSCRRCHEAARPTEVRNSFSHENTAIGDCVVCHASGAGSSWQKAEFRHSSSLVSCVQCHGAYRPDDEVEGYSHVNSGMGDCLPCHISGMGTSWSGAIYQHLPVPKTCVACHEARRPVDVVQGYSHSTAGMGDCVQCHKQPGVKWSGAGFSHNPAPSSCKECHIYQRPLQSVGGFSHLGGGSGDCVSCHKQPGVRWSGASFSHTPARATCVDCHLAKRPTEIVSGFDHAVSGMGDCVSCHKQAGISWSGAGFSHSSSLTSCLGCHESKRPSEVVNGFDHKVSGTGDCVSCHQQPGIRWSGASFTHTPLPTTCIGCHALKRPGAPVNGFNHTTSGMGDCVSCHLQAGSTWAGGSYNHSPSPTACASCHEASRPVKIINKFSHTFAGMGDCVNCHNVNRGNWSGGRYAHAPRPEQCAVCHAADRPKTSINGFSHATSGMGDCVSCHKQTGVTWSGGSFAHSPAPVACIGCHAAKRPATLVNGFDHARSGTGDCVSCHKNPGGSWAGASFNHVPAPPSCASCHTADRPEKFILRFSHSLAGMGDCVTCHKKPGVSWTGGTFNHAPRPESCRMCHKENRPTTIVEGFDHAVSGTGDCVNCHKKPGIVWAGAVFNHKPVPTTCVACHARNRPTEIVNRFVHSVAGTGDCVNCHSKPGVRWSDGRFNHSPAPTECAVCHSTNRPTTVVGGFDHSIAGTGDCVSCHGKPGVEWAGGTFDHKPVPTSCVVCHAARRPSEIVNRFVHTLAGTGDCVDCHSQPGVTWGDGRFNHSPTPTQCAVCHDTNRPTTVVGGFDHSIAGTGDCVNCHHKPGREWVGGLFDHKPVPTTCVACHAATRPVEIVNRFLHSVGGTGDCVNCHSQPGVTWNDGRYAHAPTPTQCAVCHSSNRPTTIVNGFDHAVGGTGDCVSCHKKPGVTWAGGVFGHKPVPTTCVTCHAAKRPTELVHRFLHSVAGTGDCVNCHSSPGVTWGDGRFNHSPAPTQCAVCHSSNRPTTIVNGFDHSVSGTGDCVSCHKKPGVAWAGGMFDHKPTPTSCIGCHLNKRPGTIVNRFLHMVAGTGDCVNCHFKPGVSWTGGIFNHTPVPDKCTVCHSVNRPTGIVSGFDHNTYGGDDCSYCHKTPGVRWSGAIYDHNTTVPSTCISCHQATRPTNVVNRFSHSVAGMGDCINCHKKAGVSWNDGTYKHTPAPTECLVCHISNRPTSVVSGFDHAVSGTGDCVSCHHKPGDAWVGGTFDHKPPPTTCLNCHQNTRPPGTVNRFAHSVAGMGDCINCHKKNSDTWSGGTYNHSPVPTQCMVCHISNRPTTIVNGFNHRVSGTADCVNCHKKPGVTWKR